MPTLKPPCCKRRRQLVVLSTVVAASLAAACRGAPAPTPAPRVSDNAWAVVDGREITRDQVEKTYLRLRDPAQPVTEEESLTAKLSVLNDLIVQDILLAKARELKVEVADSELDKAHAEAKQNISAEALQKELTRRGATEADMREALRRELLTQKMLDREVGSKITVSAQEVSDFFLANRTQFNLAEDAYRIAQIVITPVRDAQVTNRTGDDATTPQAASTKVAMLMEKLKAGTSFADLAMDYSEDPDSAPRGGDLGMVPVSSLKQAPPQLRDAVMKKAPGTVSVASAGGAHSLVLVVAHAPAGQRDLSTPGVSEGISEQLKARKEQLLRAAYLTAVRDDADVVNYLARRLVESQGKLPGAQAAAPTAK